MIVDGIRVAANSYYQIGRRLFVFGQLLLLFSAPILVYSEAETPPKSKTLIVLDPGHGGMDSGTASRTGLKEKVVVLDIAKRLKRILSERYHHPVRLTRNSDVQRALPERTSFANGKRAALFVSLHVNSSGTGTVRGFEAYYLDTSGDRAAMRLAEAENRANGHGGDGTSIDDIQFILSDLVQSSKMHDSIVLAHAIEEQVISSLKGRWSGVRSLGVKKAPFYVLMGARMPCVLLEMFFADNAEDARFLGQESFREDIARAIGKGIDKFLGD
jgi:N-acetylmuramoyl-L-alanine amidase